MAKAFSAPQGGEYEGSAVPFNSTIVQKRKVCRMTAKIILTIQRGNGPSRADLLDSLSGNSECPRKKHFMVRFWDGDWSRLHTQFGFTSPCPPNSVAKILVIIGGVKWIDEGRMKANISGIFKPYGEVNNVWFPFTGHYDAHERTGQIEVEYAYYSADPD